MNFYYSGFYPQIKYGVLDYMKNILCAFPEMGKNKVEKIPEISKTHGIFLDSGGFSIRNNGLKLNVNDYKEFIRNYGKYFEVIANMDTTTKEETLSNQKILESTGYKILPVFHWSDLKNNDKDLLEYYCNNYDYIGLGGVAGVGLDRKQKEYYLGYCFSVAIKHKTKIHGFGITSLNELIKYPFYSVDSTSRLSQAKFNSVGFFKNGKWSKYNLTQSRDKLGVDFALIEYGEKVRRHLKAFTDFERYIKELHRVKGMEYWN